MLLPDVMILISRSMQSGAARNIGRSPMPNAAKHFINVERRASKCSIRLSYRFSIGYFSSFFFSSSAALSMSFFSSCASFCSMSRAFLYSYCALPRALASSGILLPPKRIRTTIRIRTISDKPKDIIFSL